MHFLEATLRPAPTSGVILLCFISPTINGGLPLARCLGHLSSPSNIYMPLVINSCITHFTTQTSPSAPPIINPTIRRRSRPQDQLRWRPHALHSCARTLSMNLVKASHQECRLNSFILIRPLHLLTLTLDLSRRLELTLMRASNQPA